MNTKERKQKRYLKRRAERQAKQNAFVDSLPSFEEVFSYQKLFKYGLDCCKGLRWKQSVQNFEMHLFSNTARNRKAVLEGKYKPKKLKRFKLSERGKTRIIDAPEISDRQIQKALCKEVLTPLYSSKMIHDNGASLRNKGLEFSQHQLDKALRKYVKRYGMNGWIIIADFKGFFPNANRSVILKNHRLIKDTRIKDLLDQIVNSCPGDQGMPLGVEPSQLEMLRLPSELDNYMCCQLHLKGFGHYMDDYHIFVPPDNNPKEIVKLFVRKAAEYGIEVSEKKTKIIPIGQSFKFCKRKRIFSKDGKIVKRGARDSYIRSQTKIKMFARVVGLRMSYEDVRNSMNSILAYYRRTDDHNIELKLRRLFYSQFGFSCENLKEFRRRNANAICMSSNL